MSGTLYLVGTPIGNLEDMTYRAVRVLGEVDLIAAEDTRHSRGLLTHYDIHTPLVSYHEHNKAARGPELIARLLAGENIACISDAGLPGIADPGADLARRAIEAGIAVTALPGANAALTALIASGLDTVRFSFVGFLPRTGEKRAAVLAEISEQRETLIFYEAPHRLAATLAELAAALGGGRAAALARELTKKFEEYRRGTLGELSEIVKTGEPRGEYVIIIAGYDAAAEKVTAAASPAVGTAEWDKLAADGVAELAAQGVPVKEACRQVAQRLNVSRREIYQLVMKKDDK